MEEQSTDAGRDSAPVHLTPRDIHLFQLLRCYRFLTNDLVRKLVFFTRDASGRRIYTSPRNVRRRLHMLLEQNYLRAFRAPVKTGEEAFVHHYWLGPKAVPILAEAAGVSDVATLCRREAGNKIFLLHTMLTESVMASFELGLDGCGVLRQLPIGLAGGLPWVNEWAYQDPSAVKKEDRYLSYDRVYDHQSKLTLTVYPDSVTVLAGVNELAGLRRVVFIEADRATVPHKRMVEKLAAYAAYQDQHRYRKYAPEADGMKVLLVFSSARRLQSVQLTLSRLSRIQELALLGYAGDVCDPKKILTDKIWTTPRGEKLSLLT